MTACDDFIKKIESILPERCTVKDLIKVGIYNNHQSARTARKMKTSPPYFQFGRRVVYLKPDILVWLERAKKGCQFENDD